MRIVPVVLLAILPVAARAQGTRDTVTLAPIVTVARASAEASRLPYAVGAASTGDWRGRPSLGLDEVLATMPGVFVTNRFNPAQDQAISIRGFGARSAFGVRGLKVILDGIPQTLPDGQGQLTNVDVAEVDRVEVLRGAAASLYGNASGGVISLWTVPQAGPTDLAPMASGVAGADGLTKWRVGAAAPLGSASVALDGSRTTSDGYRLHSHADIRRLRAVVQETSGGTRLTLAVHGVDEPFVEDPGQLTRAEADTGPRSAAPRNLLVNAGKDVTQWEGGVTLEHYATGGTTLSAAVFGVRRTLQNPTAATTITLGRWAYGTRIAATHGGRLGEYPATLMVGADAQWQRDDRLNRNPATSAVTLDQLERVNELGPFLEGELDLSQRLLVRAGVRYDRVSFAAADRLLTDGDQSGERTMAAPSASLGVVLALSQAIAPYATVGTGFETPTTTELTNRPDGLGGFNPGLNPQHATNIELGARGAVQTIAYNAALFQTDVRDELIPFQVPGQLGRQYFQNAGSARHRGVELGAALSPVGGIQLVAAYTFADYRFETFRTATETLDGKYLPGIPRHYLYASLRLARGGFWAAVDETLTSEVFVDNANTTANPGWTVTGARAGWDGSVGRWRLAPFAGVTNVFDKAYLGSVVINAANGRYYEPAAGRSVYVGFKVE
jgi:iron complex outermembrane receptor protein